MVALFGATGALCALCVYWGG